MTASLLTDDAALHALRPEWEALWHQAAASPFASPAWLLAWWRQFGTGRPRVSVLRDGGRLLGLLPLYRMRDAEGDKILPIGIGITDDLGPLLAPDAPADAASILLATALRDAGDGLCDLTDVPPGSPLRDAAIPPDWRAAWRQADPRPVLPLPATIDGLRDAIPARTLRKLRMNRNRAERVGGYTIETATPDTVAALFAHLARLHGARWVGRGESGVLADPRVIAFHHDAAPALLGCGGLRLQVLRLRGEVAAAIHALPVGRDRIQFYLSGFDAAHAHESPGSLLLGAMLEEAVREGRREADFLRGGEAYKYDWGATDRFNWSCRLTRDA